jgi:type IV pilus assembly protein PilM
MPGLENNLADPAAVTLAIRVAMGHVQPRTKAVTVVVPDSAVRVFVLDFDTLPTRQDEALPVLRFRLRKSVPFDVEEAGISYQVLSEGSTRTDTQWKVLAAIMPGPVLAEYEAVVRSAGYEPGAVLPVSLAVLAAVETQEAVLAVHLSARTLTTTILAGSDILLYRTVELPVNSGGSDDPDATKAEVQRSIAVAAAFFEDRLHVRPYRLLYSGILTAREFAELVDDPAMTVDEVVARPAVGMASMIGRASLAGVTGALAGTN